MITQPLTVLDHHYQELSIDGKDVIKGLTEKPKNLPPKYFYDDPGSLLFEKIKLIKKDEAILLSYIERLKEELYFNIYSSILPILARNSYLCK